MANGTIIPGAPRDFDEYDTPDRARMRGPGYGDTLDIVQDHAALGSTPPVDPSMEEVTSDRGTFRFKNHAIRGKGAR